MTEEVDQKLRYLKALVIFLGLLMVASLFVLVIMIADGATKLDDTPVASSTSQGTGEGLNIAIPPGARVTNITPEGDNLRVMLDTEQGQAMLLVDAATGEVLSRVDFTAAE